MELGRKLQWWDLVAPPGGGLLGGCRRRSCLCDGDKVANLLQLPLHYADCCRCATHLGTQCINLSLCDIPHASELMQLHKRLRQGGLVLLPIPVVLRIELFKSGTEPLELRLCCWLAVSKGSISACIDKGSLFLVKGSQSGVRGGTAFGKLSTE